MWLVHSGRAPGGRPASLAERKRCCGEGRGVAGDKIGSLGIWSVLNSASTDRPVPWRPSIHAQVRASGLSMMLERPELDGYTNAISSFGLRTRAGKSDLERIFEDVFFDMTQLLEEYRFEAGTGALYAMALEDELRALHESQSTGLASFGIPTSVRAVLSGYSMDPPFPEGLLSDPAQPIAGMRLLGGWWAAQVLDTALVRGWSILDRVASMLACAAGAVVDEERMPAFRPSELRKLNGAYGTQADWLALKGLFSNLLFDFTKDYRDGFIHRKRLPMQMHGAHIVVEPDGTRRRGIDSEDHVDLVLAFYNEIVVPCCSLGARLVSTVDALARLREGTSKRPHEPDVYTVHWRRNAREVQGEIRSVHNVSGVARSRAQLEREIRSTLSVMYGLDSSKYRLRWRLVQ